jgi:hypothetical protein
LTTPTSDPEEIRSGGDACGTVSARTGKLKTKGIKAVLSPPVTGGKRTAFSGLSRVVFLAGRNAFLAKSTLQKQGFCVKIK